MAERLGKSTIKLTSCPRITSWASMAGEKEGKGPLASAFDVVLQDDLLGEKSWELAESRMVQETVKLCLEKAALKGEDIDMLLGGDLLNQIVSASFAARALQIPFMGLYGACSTMAESLCLAGMIIEGGSARRVLCTASSHFASAERQYRFPLEMGGQRTPSAQWTVTGAGATLVCDASMAQNPVAMITHITPGRVIDLGILDASNMGAAMAPAAADTLHAHMMDTGRRPGDYDLIVSGDLGMVGHAILRELMAEKGMPLLDSRYADCGLLIFDATQDVHAGGSGCGCSASVLNGELLGRFAKKKLNRMLFMATGALMSPISSQQGESIPGVAHAVAIERVGVGG